MINKIDYYIINRLQKIEMPLARMAIFVVYFWFGLLKLLDLSPATPLIQSLFYKTINFMQFPIFYGIFSIFEIVIGVFFLLKGWERLAIFLLLLHLIMIALPLILLPEITWQSFLVPTLEGQYIIKNILIAAIAVVIGSKLVPMKN